MRTGGARNPSRGSRIFVSDFFDFSIYIDAHEETIENWYVARFLKLRDTVFRNPDSYFNRYSKLSKEAATDKAHSIWREINGPNLRDNIQPTRERALLACPHWSPTATIRRLRARQTSTGTPSNKLLGFHDRLQARSSVQEDIPIKFLQ